MEEQLQQRITMVTQQLQQMTASVLELTERLVQAKSQASQLQGHLNEANFMLDEFRKFQSKEKDTNPIATENELKSGGLNNSND